MLEWWRQRQYRNAKDKRDVDMLIIKHGGDAHAWSVAAARSCPKGSREERHWTRISKLVAKRR